NRGSPLEVRRFSPPYPAPPKQGPQQARPGRKRFPAFPPRGVPPAGWLCCSADTRTKRSPSTGIAHQGRPQDSAGRASASLPGILPREGGRRFGSRSHVVADGELTHPRLLEILPPSPFACGAPTLPTGFLFGGALGLFLSGAEWSTPVDTTASTSQQVKQTFRDMGRKSFASAKNLAVIGAVFSGTECVIESYRAKTDLYNGAAAGCVTGGALAARSEWAWLACRRSFAPVFVYVPTTPSLNAGRLNCAGGPKAVVLGCASFAAFSSAFEYYFMHRED
ncbi:MAG: Tim17/Tim22/Tim23/Pmp24 family-domain-containing protein, partial [Olpidium bornovanus]